jgi:hypothetical protein
MGGEGMAEGVGGYALFQPSLPDRCVERFLRICFMQMISPHLAGRPYLRQRRTGKTPMSGSSFYTPLLPFTILKISFDCRYN